MVAGAALADLRMKTGQESGGDVRAPTALVIGLGGGALPMVLRRMYPNLKVAAVELDPEMAGIAKEHFGLKESQHLKVPHGIEVFFLASLPGGIRDVRCELFYHIARVVCLSRRAFIKQCYSL